MERIWIETPYPDAIAYFVSGVEDRAEVLRPRAKDTKIIEIMKKILVDDLNEIELKFRSVESGLG